MFKGEVSREMLFSNLFASWLLMFRNFTAGDYISLWFTLLCAKYIASRPLLAPGSLTGMVRGLAACTWGHLSHGRFRQPREAPPALGKASRRSREAEVG